MNLKTHLLAAALLATLTLPAHAELILSGNPSAKDIAARDKNFSALAIQLSETLGEPVRYVAPINEMGYAQDIRKGRYDILIDGPHLAAWRSNKGLHKYVAEANLPLTFLVVVPVTDKTTTSPHQLIGRKVCIPAAPNIANLMFMNLYPNPLQLPTLNVVDGSVQAIEELLSGQCIAAVVNASVFENNIDKAVSNQLKVAYNTRPLPGNIMTVSDKLTEAKRSTLIKRVTGADPANDKLLQAMTAAGVRGAEPSKIRWHAVNSENVKGLDQILIQQSYGWQ